MALTAQQRNLLDEHLRLVLAANERTNITRITDWEQGQLLHIEDSLVGLPEVEDAPAGLLADIGSGAGFPGIPLAIVTQRNISLVESVGQKAALLEGFAEELGLCDRVRVYAQRVEEHVGEGIRYAVVTARALSSLPSLMELASPLLQEGGRLVCYKATALEEELESALPLQEKLAMKFVSLREHTLSDGQTKRCIVVFEKHGEPLVKLPRTVGKAQRNPYKK